MKPISLEKEISSVTYPGRGIVIGRSADGTKAVIAYFIMGRSENSRNRIFVETEDGIKTQAFDESKLIDPSLIIIHLSENLTTRQSLQTVTRQIQFMSL